MRSEALRERLAATGLLVRWPEGAPADFAGVTTDSARVRSGMLFMAYAGSATDAHAFVGDAAQAGAAAAIVEHPVDGARLPLIEVSNGRRAASVAAALDAGDPAESLQLLAVTGTNGKTTTVHVLRHLFGAAAPAASIGTLGAVDS